MNNWLVDNSNAKTFHAYNNGEINFRIFCKQNDVLKEVQAYLGAHLKEELLVDACTWDIIASREESDYQRLQEQVKEDAGIYIKMEESGTLTVRDDILHICCLACIPGSTSLFSFMQDSYCTVRRLSIRSFDYSIVLHASACRLKEKTVLFLGDKGAGKSLVSDSILMKYDSDFIAADQTIIFINGQGIRCRGNITSYRVWAEQNILSGKYDKYKKLLMHAPDMEEVENRIINSKINFPPCVVFEFLGKNILMESIPDFFFFLGEGKEECITEVHSEDAYRLLKKYLVQDGYKDCELDILKKEELERKQVWLIQEIIASCRFWRIGKTNAGNVEDRFKTIVETMMRCNNE